MKVLLHLGKSPVTSQVQLLDLITIKNDKHNPHFPANINRNHRKACVTIEEWAQLHCCDYCEWISNCTS